MFCQGFWGNMCEPDPRANQSAMALVGIPHIQEGDEGHLSQHLPFRKVPSVLLLWRMAKEKDHSGYTLLPDGLAA